MAAGRPLHTVAITPSRYTERQPPGYRSFPINVIYTYYIHTTHTSVVAAVVVIIIHTHSLYSLATSPAIVIPFIINIIIISYYSYYHAFLPVQRHTINEQKRNH